MSLSTKIVVGFFGLHLKEFGKSVGKEKLVDFRCSLEEPSQQSELANSEFSGLHGECFEIGIRKPRMLLYRAWVGLC